ncbi:MAG: hypothetical protein FWH01_18255, partial [Oscillospiraceae bacterium]|nr:hypothetical protein [Oscillospiraceae bacterium]
MVIDWSYVVATLLIVTSITYFVIGTSTYSADKKSKVRQKYIVAVTFLAIWSLGFGVMTIAGDEGMARLFWSIAFVASSMFFPSWVGFLLYLTSHSSKRMDRLVSLLYLASAFFASLCIVSSDIVFINTDFG